MKSVTALVVGVGVAALVALQDAEAFSTSFTGSQLVNGVSSHSTLRMEYIPSGMSKEQWLKVKEQERKANKGKNLGQVGITSFKSRSFAEWQKAGGKNLFPVDPKKVKDPKEIPYMQRPGGKPDDSDLKKGGFSFLGGPAKKKEIEKPAEEPKKTNWWNLS